MSDYPDRIRVGTDVYGGLYVDPTNHAANVEYVRADVYKELVAKFEQMFYSMREPVEPEFYEALYDRRANRYTLF